MTGHLESGCASARSRSSTVRHPLMGRVRERIRDRGVGDDTDELYPWRYVLKLDTHSASLLSVPVLLPLISAGCSRL
jgi:hypothetical protein